MPAATWLATTPRNASCQPSKACRLPALERQHAHQPSRTSSGSAIWLWASGRPGSGISGAATPPRLFADAGAHRAAVAQLAVQVADAQQAPVAGDGADQPLAEHHLGPDAALVVAAAGDGEQAPPGLVQQQHLGVVEPEVLGQALQHRRPAARPGRPPGSCAARSAAGPTAPRGPRAGGRAASGSSSAAGRSAGGGASGGSRCPLTANTSSTSKMSDASSRKIPCMPVWEAIASMRAAIDSNSGPAVSDRT